MTHHTCTANICDIHHCEREPRHPQPHRCDCGITWET